MVLLADPGGRLALYLGTNMACSAGCLGRGAMRGLMISGSSRLLLTQSAHRIRCRHPWRDTPVLKVWEEWIELLIDWLPFRVLRQVSPFPLGFSRSCRPRDHRSNRKLSPFLPQTSTFDDCSRKPDDEDQSSLFTLYSQSITIFACSPTPPSTSQPPCRKTLFTSSPARIGVSQLTPLPPFPIHHHHNNHPLPPFPTLYYYHKTTYSHQPPLTV